MLSWINRPVRMLTSACFRLRRRLMSICLRSVNDPIALTPVVRRQVAALNRDLPIYDVQTMANRVSNAASRARFNAILLGIFAIPKRIF